MEVCQALRTVPTQARIRQGKAWVPDAQNSRKGVEGAKADLVFGECFLILMLTRTLLGIIKNY